METSFQSDLRNKGQPFEEVLLNTLRSKGLYANPNLSSTLKERQSHDISIATPNGTILLESKMDWLSLYTGNYCIELEAVNHSKSDYFVYGAPMVSVFTRQQINELISMFPIKIGGDQPNNRLVNVPKKFLKLNNMGMTLWDFIKQVQQ